MKFNYCSNKYYYEEEKIKCHAKFAFLLKCTIIKYFYFFSFYIYKSQLKFVKILRVK